MTKEELDAIRARAGIITGPTWQHLYRQADADRAALLAEVDRLTAPLPKEDLDCIRARIEMDTEFETAINKASSTWQHLYRQADADRAALLAEVDRLTKELP